MGLVFSCSEKIFLLLFYFITYVSSQQWKLVASPITSSSVVASDLDFADGFVAPGPVPSLISGTPVVAIGSIEADGATLTTFYYLSQNPLAWTSFATHSPGMAQSYDAFSLKFTLGRIYLALRIAGEDIASVLRSGTSGSDGEFEGCYAFDGFLFDFAIDHETGDMRLATSPDNKTVGVQSYAKKGWDVYPASDEFSTFLPLLLPTPIGSIVSISASPATSDGLLIIAVSTSFNVTSIFSAPLSSTSKDLPKQLGKPLIGSQAAITAGGGIACVSVFDSDLSLQVSCIDLTTPNALWIDLGLADPPNSSEVGLSPAIAIALGNTGSRTVFAAARADKDNAAKLLIARCTLSNIDQPVSNSCLAGQWTNMTLVAPNPITAFDLKVNRFNDTYTEVFVIITTGQATSSDQVLIYKYVQ